jgi:hypothetical protein
MFSTLIVVLAAVSAFGQTGRIWVEPDTTFFQRDTFITVNVKADGNLTGIKAMRLDLDMNPAAVAPDTARTEMGEVFSESDTVTFYFHYLTSDSGRLTVDIAVLSGLETVDGPGTLVTFPLNTIGFGESEIAIAEHHIRDVANDSIPAETENGWIKVCQFVGDMNADNRVDIGDLTYLIAYLYLDGPEPTPWASGDVDCIDIIDIGDLTYLIKYLYLGGDPLCDLCL